MCIRDRYDMLNEKDKEIKTTVKSVNATNTQARDVYKRQPLYS